MSHSRPTIASAKKELPNGLPPLETEGIIMSLGSASSSSKQCQCLCNVLVQICLLHVPHAFLQTSAKKPYTSPRLWPCHASPASGYHNPLLRSLFPGNPPLITVSLFGLTQEVNMQRMSFRGPALLFGCNMI